MFVRLAYMSGEADPDAALMLRVKQGDTAAFAELVDKYKQPVMNVAYRMLHDATEAEDIAQAVFVQVFKSRDRYRTSSRFATWLYTIVKNLCLNEIRRRGRRQMESIEAPAAGREDQAPPQFEDTRMVSPPERVLHGELEAKIEQALAELPEPQRLAIAFCRQEDMSYEEIAQVLGYSLAATKTIIHRARARLKNRLKPYLQSGAWHPRE